MLCWCRAKTALSGKVVCATARPTPRPARGRSRSVGSALASAHACAQEEELPSRSRAVHLAEGLRAHAAYAADAVSHAVYHTHTQAAQPVDFIKVDAQGLDAIVIASARSRLGQVRRFALEVISDDCDSTG